MQLAARFPILIDDRPRGHTNFGDTAILISIETMRRYHPQYDGPWYYVWLKRLDEPWVKALIPSAAISR